LTTDKKVVKINSVVQEIKYRIALIKRGGGTGPMKPGNHFTCRCETGANSCRSFILADKRG